jgi:hypothetical protein
MLDEQRYQSWCRSLGFKQETKELLDQIRSSPPARRVGGGKKNVAGRYPSRKMGVTIQFESHSNELAAVLEYENDPDCMEFYDQPQPSIPLEYMAKNGRRLHVLHTADYFVLRTASAGWVECKTERDLATLANTFRRKNPKSDFKILAAQHESHELFVGRLRGRSMSQILRIEAWVVRRVAGVIRIFKYDSPLDGDCSRNSGRGVRAFLASPARDEHAADIDERVGKHTQTHPAMHARIPFIAAAI